MLKKLLAIIAVTAFTALAQQARRPNIMLIIGDDIGIDATSDMYPGLIDGLLKQYGPSGRNHPDYKKIQGKPASTPNLNALAKAGMRFTQAWVQPFCANTRASILTGLYPAKSGVLDYNGLLTQKQHSFVNDLKDKGGYATGVFGKYHMAGLGQYPGLKPKEAGFDLYQGNMNGGVATYWNWDYHVQDATSPADQFRTERAPMRSIPGVAPTTYAPVVNVADTLTWIKDVEAKNPNQPWLAWVAFNLAHITGQQIPNPMAVPNIDTMDDISIKEMKACGGTFGTANVGNCTDKQLMRAMTNSMDFLIGKMLKEVDAIDPNTYIIYLGDNGTWMFGNKREFIDNMYITSFGRGKGTAYESGARVEMAIRGPRIKAGTVSNVPVSGVDLFTTILNMAGLEAPKTVPNRDGSGTVAVDGVSLMPVIFDGSKQIRDPNMGYLLTETTNPVRNDISEAGARNEKFKVMCAENTASANCLFFNLADDPLEEYPLAKPESCAKYQDKSWTSSTQDWHYCRLQDVLAKESFLAPNWQWRTPPAPAGQAKGKGAFKGKAK